MQQVLGLIAACPHTVGAGDAALDQDEVALGVGLDDLGRRSIRQEADRRAQGRHAAELARAAVDRGYEEVWMAEVNGGDSYALCAAVAQALPGVRVGTAVVPAQTRTPMMHAMSAMTLSQLTQGNFILGIGLSSPNIVHDWAGQPYERPLTTMREHVEVLRHMLSGQKTSFEGKTLSVKNFRLGGKPVGEVPIYLGALNPGMLRLAGALCDGICLNMVPEGALPQVLAEVRAGAEDAGRDPGTLEVVARLHVVRSDDPAGDGVDDDQPRDAG